MVPRINSSIFHQQVGEWAWKSERVDKKKYFPYVKKTRLALSQLRRKSAAGR